MRRSKKFILVEGARQNTLKNVTVRLPIGELTVVTGVSGSGKSSLAFDTIYAEGQRRYVETFSPYARQFLERMDQPRVDRVDGIPPAIAIDQTNPVRTSRSTVGTMTELADHLKLLFARAAGLFCGGCGREVRRDAPETIAADAVPPGPGAAAARLGPAVSWSRSRWRSPPISPARRSTGTWRGRATRGCAGGGGAARGGPGPGAADAGESRPPRRGLEAALRVGGGRVALVPVLADGSEGAPRRFSADLHCPDCDRHYADPTPDLFSFNSPVGACPSLPGLRPHDRHRLRLVVPDESLTLRGGAIRPWQSGSSRECQDDLLRFGSGAASRSTCRGAT